MKLNYKWDIIFKFFFIFILNFYIPQFTTTKADYGKVKMNHQRKTKLVSQPTTVAARISGGTRPILPVFLSIS